MGSNTKKSKKLEEKREAKKAKRSMVKGHTLLPSVLALLAMLQPSVQPLESPEEEEEAAQSG